MNLYKTQPSVGFPVTVTDNLSTHINAGFQLMQRDPATVAQHLSADVLADWGGSWRKQINT